MEILDKTEVRNKEEDVDMKKMHSITNIHPRYYDAAFYSYYRELNWNTSIFKEEREELEELERKADEEDEEAEREELEELEELERKALNDCDTDDDVRRDLPDVVARWHHVRDRLHSLIPGRAWKNRFSGSPVYERDGHIDPDEWDVERTAIYEKAPDCYCGCNINKYLCLYTPCCRTKMHLICLYAAMGKKDDAGGGWSVGENIQHCPYCRGCWSYYKSALLPAQ